MRVSTDKDDPGYHPRYFTSTIKVYLDGVEVKEYITADEEIGYVIVVARDESGKRIRDGDTARTITRSGTVKIKAKQAAE